MRKFLIIQMIALAVFASPSVVQAQQEDDEELYEAFDPNAAKLVFARPQPIEIERTNLRTMSREKIKVEPFDFQKKLGLEIYMFRIGQADSMLVVGPAPERRTLLIDLGVSKDGRFAAKDSAEHVGQRIVDITGKTHIDYFLLSHFHQDHFGTGRRGVTKLMAHSDFTFGTVIDTGDLGSNWVKRSQGATEYLERVRGWSGSAKIAKHSVAEFGDQQIDLGGEVKVDIVTLAGKIGPDDEGVHARYDRRRPGHYRRNPASENDLSIGVEISLGDFEFWTGGDLSGADGQGTDPTSGSGYTNVEYPLMQAWRQKRRESDVEIYRANHHGSRYSSSRDFLNMLDPEFILASAEVGHHHPSKSMVRRGAATAKLLATDVDPETWTPDTFAVAGGQVVGEIRIFVEPDGKSYELDGKTYRSFTDAEEAEEKDQSE
ncbi:MAG: hypothetical protein WA793_02165 [Sphingorhabdus sp.]|uniref:ComEC/Rec2 family competence protein n=1 Tax=Sphingorhabdus sp. TaxID=1902408 RepID=UPI003CBEEACE